jgi:hypothetical protein
LAIWGLCDHLEVWQRPEWRMTSTKVRDWQGGAWCVTANLNEIVQYSTLSISEGPEWGTIKGFKGSLTTPILGSGWPLTLTNWKDGVKTQRSYSVNQMSGACPISPCTISLPGPTWLLADASQYHALPALMCLCQLQSRLLLVYACSCFWCTCYCFYPLMYVCLHLHCHLTAFCPRVCTSLLFYPSLCTPAPWVCSIIFMHDH